MNSCRSGGHHGRLVGSPRSFSRLGIVGQLGAPTTDPQQVVADLPSRQQSKKQDKDGQKITERGAERGREHRTPPERVLRSRDHSGFPLKATALLSGGILELALCRMRQLRHRLQTTGMFGFCFLYTHACFSLSFHIDFRL